MRGRLLRGWVAGAAGVVVATGAVTSGCAMKTHVRTISAAIVNGEPAFAPAVITVRRADKVRLRVGNTTATKHGFSVDRYGVAQTVDPGQTITLDLRAAHRGTFLIYCQLHPAHRPAELRVR